VHACHRPADKLCMQQSLHAAWPPLQRMQQPATHGISSLAGCLYLIGKPLTADGNSTVCVQAQQLAGANPAEAPP
jgi:hypothetical protein